jgi:nucleotide-binding universal stress UspA family protein
LEEEALSGLHRKKVLVAVDGSEQAFEAVRYVSRVFPPDRVEIVLFHILIKIPESFWDLDSKPAYNYRLIDIKKWEIEQEKTTHASMEHARRILLDRGIPEEAVTVNIQPRKTGIAMDIVEESRKGYDAVVVGRTGLSELKDIVLGSIAVKLIEKLAHVPLWVVGGAPEPGKLLLCLDNSDGARRAVDHVAEVIGDCREMDLTLFHAVRRPGIFRQIFGKAAQGNDEKEWLDSAAKEFEEVEKALEPAFEDAKSRLMTAGCAPRRIHRKIVCDVGSRAGAIVEEAMTNGHDTIVLGRRGLSKMQEFFMGRVSNKVLHLAKEKAVWIVN